MSKTIQTPSHDGYLTVKQVAERYPVTEAQLYGFRRKGVGPRSVKVGKPILYPEAETAAWFAALAGGEAPTQADSSPAPAEAACEFFLDVDALLKKHRGNQDLMKGAGVETLTQCSFVPIAVLLFDHMSRANGFAVTLANGLAEAHPEFVAGLDAAKAGELR